MQSTTKVNWNKTEKSRTILAELRGTFVRLKIVNKWPPMESLSHWFSIKYACSFREK